MAQQTPSNNQLILKSAVIFLTVLFAAVEMLVAAGFINVNTPYLPANLQTQSRWYLNPVVLAVGITLIVNAAGFVENVVIENQNYDLRKFVETFYKYLPMLVIFTQFTQYLPTLIPGISQEAASGAASALSLAIDILKRTFQKPNGNGSSATLASK